MRIRIQLAAVLLALSSGAAAQQPPPFSAADMLDIVEFARGGEPVLAPTGDLVAYVAVDVGPDANVRAARPTGHLWTVAATGGEPRRLTAPDERGDAPMWSPDGKQLAYVQTRDGGARIAVWDRAGGRARLVGPSLGDDRASLPLAPVAPQWTRDSRFLVVPVPEAVAPSAEKPRVRVIRSTDVIVPGDARFTDTRRWRLTAIDVASGESRVLTPEAVALRSFQVAADGAHVLYRAVVPETLGRFRNEQTRDWVVSMSNGSAPRAPLGDRRVAWVTFSPRGDALLFPEGSTLSSLSLADGAVRPVARDFPARTTQPALSVDARRLAVLAARPGTGPPDAKMYSILRPTQDVLVVDLASGQSRVVTDRGRDDEVADLVWGDRGRTLFYRSVDPVSYKESLVRWDSTTSSARVVLSVDESLSDMSVALDGSRLAFGSATATRPADAFTVLATGEGRARITDLNPQLAKFTFTAPVMFDFHSADGDPLRGLLYKPAGAAAGVPVVTYVYEKLTSQKNRFNPEAQLHLARGYAYLMPDVLVKPGYTGESFVKSVVPAVNAVRAMGFTNGRFGITGGSFGGYAGLFLVSQVDLFAAAVVRAPPSEFFSTWGDGRDRDIWTIETGQARTGGTPWEVPERYIGNSPFFFADRVRTPVLIMHGEKDFTVPLQQGEMMFYALRALGRTAELVLYREGDHSIVRGSRADFLDFHARMLGWWEQYLRVRPTESAARHD
jgi:dipeptidyl aminopeptidase/acylaminoacyl peptidase